MTKLIFCLKSRIPSLFYDQIVDGQHITIEGQIYENLMKRPPNRRPLRRLVNETKQELLVIYG